MPRTSRTWMLGIGAAAVATIVTAGWSAERPLSAPATARAQGEPQPPALPKADEPVTLDPANFTTRIDNPYWPVAPGNRWVYRERSGEGSQRVVVTVLRRTKRVAGVTARVVHDVVTLRGRLVEDTFDWYAQDRAGNVWYLGEDTKEYRNGRVSSTQGSWEAGVDGAQAGVIMPADPKVGLRYRQEYYKGKAEDRAQVLKLDETVRVPAGRFTGVLMSREVNPLRSRSVEYKLYAKRVGLVQVLGRDRRVNEELVQFHRGTA